MDNTQQGKIKNVGIGLWEVIAAVFFLGVFFIPFNAYDGPSILGELKNESAVLFFLLASLLVAVAGILTKKFYIPYRNMLFQLVLALFVWFIVATVLNGHNVVDYYFKRISGPERFARQYIAFIISGGVFFLAYYNIFRRFGNMALFLRLRKMMFYSMVIVTVYGVLEILIVVFKIFPLSNILRLFDYFPFTRVYLDFNLGRISSVTFEPPALATYLFTVAGWMFSYIITGKGIKKYLPAIAVIVLALFSGSRAGIIVMFLQILVFLVLLIKKRRYHQILIRILAAGLFITVIGGIIKGKEISEYVVEKITSFGLDQETHNISNKSRFGLQYAMYKTFLDYPITGVGFGQQTYVAKEYYPAWSTKNNWEFRLKYLNEDDPRFPPGYNVYLRVMAETGIVGLLLFLSLQILILYSCIMLLKHKKEESVILVVILVSMVGLYMNWLKADTFRIFGFWINLAFLIKIMHSTKFSFRKLRNKSSKHIENNK